MPVSNLGRIGFVTKGDWSAGEYKYLDVVKHVAATWICAVPTTSEEPGTGTDWQNALTAPAVTGIAEWSQLSGTQSPPLIVYDDQEYWTLITTVSDIAANKPSESPDFFKSNGLIDDAVTSELTTWSSEKINGELDTKVDASDIGTAASRDVTESSVDTTAGRLLKVRDFNIGATGNLSDFASDLNDYTIQGTFGYANTADNRPPFIGASFSNAVEVIRDSAGGRIFQISRQCGGSTDNGFVYHRVYSGTSWSPWWLSYSQRNVVGTVSQSGGVPAGAIIEQGSNANGEYVKYADGTMISWILSHDGGEISDIPMGNIFTTEFQSCTFPVQFSETPTVSIISRGSATWAGNCRTASNSGITQYRQFSATSNNTPVEVRIIAIGRWW